MTNTCVSSTMLYDFYQHWFSNRSVHPATHFGLCSNLRDYLSYRNYKPIVINIYLAELQAQLLDCFNNCTYPFGGMQRYGEEMHARTCHLNEARIQFVRDRIRDYDEVYKETE